LQCLCLTARALVYSKRHLHPSGRVADCRRGEPAEEILGHLPDQSLLDNDQNWYRGPEKGVSSGYWIKSCIDLFSAQPPPPSPCSSSCMDVLHPGEPEFPGGLAGGRRSRSAMMYSLGTAGTCAVLGCATHLAQHQSGSSRSSSPRSPHEHAGLLVRSPSIILPTSSPSSVESGATGLQIRAVPAAHVTELASAPFTSF
jgi:hypothetical protein